MADITIIMPSYNKEKYIAEALDSVFMQETSYDYHIIVADDCSTDRTIEIVKEYQNKYSNKITLLTSQTNQKLYRNVLRAYEITKTDYFCVLDPDDYWIDKYKIQKSLDFLENNKDYTIYVTDTLMLMPDGTKKDYLKHNRIKNSSFKDFLNGKAVLGCTLGSTFRNVVFKDGVPDKMKNLECETMERSFRGDTFRSVLHLFYGKAHLVPETDAVYRVTTEGLWQGISEFEQNLLNANIFKDLWLYFDKKYPELLHLSLYFYSCILPIVSKELLHDSEEKRKVFEQNINELEFYYKFLNNKYKNTKQKTKGITMIEKKYITDAREPFFDIAKQYISNDNSTILDIGSGDGNFAKYIGRNDVYMLEGNIESVEKLKKTFPNVICAKLPSLPYKDDFFDLIHLSHIVEHLQPQELYDLLKEIDRCLKLKGYIVISAPLLWSAFYADLSHIKPYHPYIFYKYLCCSNNCCNTRPIISDKYTLLREVYRYHEIQYDDSEIFIKSSFINKIFMFIKKLKFIIGFRKLEKSGYTIVLQKSK